MPARETRTKVLQNSRVSAGGRVRTGDTMGYSAPTSLGGVCLKGTAGAWYEVGRAI